MKKLLLSLVVALMSVTAFAGAAKTLTFPATGGEKVNGYTMEWTATTAEGDIWTINGFNANNNKWAYIRCGRKSNEHEASIQSPAFDLALTKMVVAVDKTSKVTSVTLTTLNGETEVSTEDVTASFQAGNVVLTLAGVKGYAYKLTINSEVAGSNGTTQISKVEMYEEGAVVKNDAGLSFSKTSFTVDYDDTEAFVAPTLSKETDAALTWESDNSEVASVDAEGNVSISGELGTAKIAVSAEETETYNAGSASYTINVVKFIPYEKATELKDGGKYVLVFEMDETLYYAAPLTKSYGELSTYKAYNNIVSINYLYDNEFTFTETQDGYTLAQPEGKLLYMKGTYNNFNVGTSEDAEGAEYWNITKNDDGTYSIVNAVKEKTMVAYVKNSYLNVGAFAADNMPDEYFLPMLYEVKGSATAIEGVQTENKVVKGIYSITGQRVSKAKKGLYIIDGKKVLVK